MQTFRKQSIIWLYFCLLVVTAVAVWFSQRSINAYWEQTYHQSSPLLSLSQYSLWQKGGELQERAYLRYAHFKNTLEQAQFGEQSEVVLSDHHSNEIVEMPITDSSDPNFSALPNASEKGNHHAVSHQTAVRFEDVFPNEHSADSVQQVTSVVIHSKGANVRIVQRDNSTIVELNAETEKTSPANTALEYSGNANNSQTAQAENLEKGNTEKLESTVHSEQPTSAYVISHQDKVLFAGDSLMQGVAPWVRKWLIQRNVKSVDLSKQSTGLSYPSFFDWPKTIETTLQNDKSIKLLIMFLGANDPWDFADPHKPSHRLKFKSPEWEAVYVQRMERILQAAEQHQVRVIWLGVPYMKSPKLNEQMRYLEQVYKTQVTPRGLFLPTETLLSNGNGKYADSVSYNGKMSKVRSKDGIHFTPSGQKILAELIQQHLIIQE